MGLKFCTKNTRGKNFQISEMTMEKNDMQMEGLELIFKQNIGIFLKKLVKLGNFTQNLNFKKFSQKL